MSRFVVLLRGVNVGANNKVPMAEFRAMLEALGYSDVKTLLNSGNAVYSAPSRSPSAMATSIATALQKRFGVTAPIIVKTEKEFRAIVDENSIVPPESEYSRFLVTFTMDNEALRGLQSLEALLSKGERFVVGEHAAYLYCANGLLESKAGEAMLGKVGRHVTSRNWATVLKIANAMWSDGGAGFIARKTGRRGRRVLDRLATAGSWCRGPFPGGGRSFDLGGRGQLSIREGRMLRYQFAGLLLSLTLLTACSLTSAPEHRTAAFVLRSLGGEALPTSVRDGMSVEAETLYVDSAAMGVLWRSQVWRTNGVLQSPHRGAHTFRWEGNEVDVFLDCEFNSPCLGIFSSRQGSLRGTELRFPYRGLVVPERVYERIR